MIAPRNQKYEIPRTVKKRILSAMMIFMFPQSWGK